uniref:C2H2-type domain-containing protein n=1 Tax=Fundulus heteroclitus TaxID=8078 RepID=A0A3Q2NXN3_FUNHE
MDGAKYRAVLDTARAAVETVGSKSICVQERPSQSPDSNPSGNLREDSKTVKCSFREKKKKHAVANESIKVVNLQEISCALNELNFVGCFSHPPPLCVIFCFSGERPFHCTQCGASFTQKGNLLRHIKLHSGEKPFKCPMCSYACRRRDALSGHLRTHSVEKPFKCNHCSRSYKQRSSLDEHRERCHVYIQSKEDSHTVRSQMGSERALLLDRLASNVAKRKSSMPQKFTGKSKHIGAFQAAKRAFFCKAALFDALRTQNRPVFSSMHLPILSDLPYPIPLNRTDINPMGLTNGHKMPLLGLPHGAQPSLGMDSFHNDASQMAQPVMYSLGHLLGGIGHQNGVPHPHSQPIPLSPLEALRVMRADGEAGALPGAVYPCGHCKVLFLDYVMFTIHMGCHGFRDPLECNVCGHRSRDRYEFSSHIARGEHRLELK